MLDCRFSFEAYTKKNAKEKATKCSLKTINVFIKVFDIYQGTAAPNCFKSHTIS